MKCRLLRTALLTVAAFTFVLLHGLPVWAQSDVSVIVLPFQINAEPKYDYLNASLPELLTQSLGEQGFKTVSQNRVRQLIKEQSVTFLDLSTARSLATAANANYAVYGSFSQIGESISLDVRLVSVEGDKPATPLYVSQTGMGNLGMAVGELTNKLSDELYAEDTIAEIDVRGLKFLDDDVVRSRLSIREGDPFNPKAMNDEIKRIFDLGYFEDVRVSVEDIPKGKKVIFDLVEKPRILAIGVLGNDAIDEDEIIEAMNTKTNSVLNPKILADDLEKIRGLYRDKGYYLAEISYELEDNKDGSARLNIVVKETKRLYVTEITLNGVESLSESDVRGEMELSTRNIISWITGSGVLKEELLEHDAAAIEQYYANHGFVDVKVSPAKVDYTEDGIHVSYDIVEGPRYRVGSVTFAGDLLVPNSDLRQITKIDDLAEDHAWFDRSVLRDDSESLTILYNDLGYAYAETNVRFDEAPDTEEKALDVTFSMTKNQKVYIRRVTIEGNTKTRDNVIRRELELTDGNLFSGTLLKRSNARLENLDLFESFDIETVPTDDPKELDLKVSVKEKSTGMISGGLGYGSYDGVFITAKINERNLFGRGYFIGLTGSFSGKKTRFDFSFTNPRVYDTYLGFGLNAFYNEEEYPDFDRESVGGSLNFSHPVGHYSTLSWGYTLERYKITDQEYYYAYSDGGPFWSSIVNVGLTRSTLNSGINPTAGWKNAVNVSAAGGIFGGDDEFIKLITDHNYYYLLPWGNEHIFHWHAQAGALLETPGGDDVPSYQRFYLGGMNSIRGYEGMAIAPRDPFGQIRGGTYEFFTNFEYLFRLSEEFGLQGVAFFDAGDSWGGFGYDSIDLKSSIGAGIRWASPFGLLRIEYGYALQDIPDQGSHGRLEFSMGQSF